MKQIIQDLRKGGVIFMLLIVIIVTLPLSSINPKLIFILFVVQIIIIIKEYTINIQKTYYLGLLISLFSLNIIGLIYTENILRGVTIITRQAVLLLFPLFYSIYKIRSINTLFKVYIIVIFCFIIFFEIETLYRFFFKSNVFPLDLDLFLSVRYTGAELTKKLNIHNAYFGMYIVFSNVLIVSFFKKARKNYILLLLLLLIIFQTLFIFQMIAKTAIILNILLVMLSIIYYLIKFKKYWILSFFGISLIIVGWFSSKHMSLPFNRIKERFFELQVSENIARETRAKIWKASIPIIKNNILIGVGTGDVENKLLKQYKINKLKIKSNIHNQYLDYFMRFGLVGLLLFLLVLIYPIYYAIKIKNYILFCFSILIMGSCMTENILSRQLGIIFYTYFNYLLYLYNPKEQYTSI